MWQARGRSTLDSEVLTNVRTCKFAGPGQKDTSVADKKTIVEIISLLPGKIRLSAAGH